YPRYPDNVVYPNTPVGQAHSQPSYPDYGGYQSLPAYAPSSDYSQQSLQPQKRRRGGLVTALILGILVVLIVGSGLGFYFGYYQPNQQQLAATQTAQAQTSATARAVATGTAQIVTATANAQASSTAQVQATAQAYQAIYTQATSGTPALDDPMSS